MRCLSWFNCIISYLKLYQNLKIRNYLFPLYFLIGNVLDNFISIESFLKLFRSYWSKCRESGSGQWRDLPVISLLNLLFSLFVMFFLIILLLTVLLDVFLEQICLVIVILFGDLVLKRVKLNLRVWLLNIYSDIISTLEFLRFNFCVLPCFVYGIYIRLLYKIYVN